jgi:hypothetical protein
VASIPPYSAIPRRSRLCRGGRYEERESATSRPGQSPRAVFSFRGVTPEGFGKLSVKQWPMASGSTPRHPTEAAMKQGPKQSDEGGLVV